MALYKLTTPKKVLKIILLMIIPWVFIDFLAPIYNTAEPYLGGWPFLYWYLLIWIFIQPVFTFIVFRYIDKEKW
jgi:hypothetical protein